MTSTTHSLIHTVQELVSWFAFASVPEVRHWLNLAILSSLHYLLDQLPHLHSHASFPLAYINTLDDASHAQALRFIFICWKVTNQAQIPRELQLKIALALWNKLDVLGVAGTGQGKTLASVLNQLLEESDKVTVMLCPLKRLQLSHVSLRFSVLQQNIHYQYSRLRQFRQNMLLKPYLSMRTLTMMK